MVRYMPLAPSVRNIDHLILRVEVPERSSTLLFLLKALQRERTPKFRIDFFEVCFHISNLKTCISQRKFAS